MEYFGKLWSSKSEDSKKDAESAKPEKAKKSSTQSMKKNKGSSVLEINPHDIQCVDECKSSLKQSSSASFLSRVKDFVGYGEPSSDSLNYDQIDKGEMPKLQIFGYDGNWWCLHADILKTYQEVYSRSPNEVAVAEVIPLDKVPSRVMHTMKNCLHEEQHKYIVDQKGPAFSATAALYMEMKRDDPHISFTSTHVDDILYSDTDSSEDSNIEDMNGHDEDDGEWCICYICEKEFANYERLFSHQMKKRHFWCDQCDNSFPSLSDLERHRSKTGHGVDEEDDFSYEQSAHLQKRTPDSDSSYNKDEVEKLIE